MEDPKVKSLVDDYIRTVRRLNQTYARMQSEGVYIYQEFKKAGFSDTEPYQLEIREIKQQVDYPVPRRVQEQDEAD